MKIPDKVRVAGIEYKVSLTDDFSDVKIGTIDYHNAEILIKTDVAVDVQKWTFYHELLHAMLTAIGYKVNDKIILDEPFIDAMASQLHCVMDNMIKD
jgi:hypothetical protein